MYELHFYILRLKKHKWFRVTYVDPCTTALHVDASAIQVFLPRESLLFIKTEPLTINVMA